MGEAVVRVGCQSAVGWVDEGIQREVGGAGSGSCSTTGVWLRDGAGAVGAQSACWGVGTGCQSGACTSCVDFAHSVPVALGKVVGFAVFLAVSPRDGFSAVVRAAVVLLHSGTLGGTVSLATVFERTLRCHIPCGCGFGAAQSLPVAGACSAMLGRKVGRARVGVRSVFRRAVLADQRCFCAFRTGICDSEGVAGQRPVDIGLRVQRAGTAGSACVAFQSDSEKIGRVSRGWGLLALAVSVGRCANIEGAVAESVDQREVGAGEGVGIGVGWKAVHSLWLSSAAEGAFESCSATCCFHRPSDTTGSDFVECSRFVRFVSTGRLANSGAEMLFLFQSLLSSLRAVAMSARVPEEPSCVHSP